MNDQLLPNLFIPNYIRNTGTRMNDLLLRMFPGMVTMMIVTFKEFLKMQNDPD